jgi:hypothetical protein
MSHHDANYFVVHLPILFDVLSFDIVIVVDLSFIMDFFLWDHIKTNIYETNGRDLDDLKKQNKSRNSGD